MSALPRVVVTAEDGTRCVVTGKAAAMIAAIALHQEAINPILIGKLRFSFAYRKLAISLAESLPQIDLEPPRVR